MTATIFDVDILETLDFDPDIACDRKFAFRFPPCAPDPARWAIYFKPSFDSCGCAPKNPVCLTCDSCWKWVCENVAAGLSCTTCWTPIPALSMVVARIETIEK